MRRTPALAVVALAAGLVAGPATPANATCVAARADQPHLFTDSVGRVKVRGFGGGSFCPGSATVCLDYNVGTVAETCRNYTGSLNEGQTGAVTCRLGVWQTWTTVTPSDGSPPKTVHSSPLVVTPMNCPSAST
ncbi:MAG TPA: hypothetical protein VNQ77_10620 [Frankiaceae bacterium]|nr:hypothetical protein [Frankiaceae bacterium]